MNGSNDLYGSTHEELCAHVLGELDAEGRARVERALETSPELRAERKRITATIGLVQDACAGSQSLSTEFLGSLDRLATPRRPWYAQSWLRAAAVFALMAGGVIALQEATKEPAPAGSRDELARADFYRPKVDIPSDGSIFVAGERTAAVAREGLMEVEEQLRFLELRDSLGEDRRVDEALRANDRGLARGGQPAPGITVIDQDGFGASTSDPTMPASGGGGPENPNVQLRSGTRLEAAGAIDDQARTRGMAITGKAGEPSVGATLNLGFEAESVAAGELSLLSSTNEAPQEGAVNLLSGLGYVGSKEVGAAETPAPSESTRVPQVGRVLTQETDVRARDEFFFGLPERRIARIEAGERVAGELPVSGGDELLSQFRELKETVVPGRAAGGGGAYSGPTTPGPAGPSAPASSPGPQPDTSTAVTRYSAGEAAKNDVADLDAGLFFEGEADLGDFGRRRQLTTAELDALVAQRVDRVLQDCRRRPHERPSAMYFRFWGDNPFVLAQLDPQSTFGVDVDTASYALARRYLAEGFLPEKAQVRTEEFVNYFAPDVAAPTEDTFAVHADLAPSRFGAGGDGFASGQRWMLRVVVRGKEVSREERQPLSLTFVIDTSGSMKRENRLELVKHSLRLLVGELDARDSIALVAFSNEARVVLPMTSAANRGVIEAAIFGLNADGGTNAEAGLKLGYELALTSLSQAARSRVVLLSDGVANIGQTDQDRIGQDVRRHREAGIYLNTVGVGLGNHNDVFLEQLADKGDGLCNYVDGPLEARRALVDNFTGAFEPIARDVKVQVEFDPSRVYRYRLLGYENRAIADVDFRNDKVDAGEVGAGHQVTALYELELAVPPTGDDAKLATIRLRWKAPSGAGRDPLEDAATEREFGVAGAAATSWEGASAGYQRAALVAQFAEILRRSTHARDDSLDELLAEVAQLDRQLGDPDFHEFVALVEKSRRLVLEARPPHHDPLARCVDTLRRNRILHAELEELRWERDTQVLEDLELQNRELEARIRQLMREKVEQEIR